MLRVALVLSGCGVQDGAEIHESVLCLVALQQRGAEVVYCAPNVEFQSVNHLTGAAGETRNVLVESARIARGKIRDIAGLGASEVDAAVLPGGFGAAKNLCTFASDGAGCRVNEATATFLRALHAAGKPIGAACIAPALLAKLFGSELHPELTIGSDAGTAAALESMGAKHVTATAGQAVVDRKNLLVTTPAYMCAASAAAAWPGIDAMVKQTLALVPR
ncbi:MAG: isoprenoid biosynthesis glyoxalase ElbB [Candidatus Brocadiae bacterium]|nr:isoprenoid biosynthesis glyoxalase ElbB [Candidatus Brocadiia bacterium]